MSLSQSASVSPYARRVRARSRILPAIRTYRRPDLRCHFSTTGAAARGDTSITVQFPLLAGCHRAPARAVDLRPALRPDADESLPALRAHHLLRLMHARNVSGSHVVQVAGLAVGPDATSTSSHPVELGQELDLTAPRTLLFVHTAILVGSPAGGW